MALLNGSEKYIAMQGLETSSLQIYNVLTFRLLTFFYTGMLLYLLFCLQFVRL